MARSEDEAARSGPVRIEDTLPGKPVIDNKVLKIVGWSSVIGIVGLAVVNLSRGDHSVARIPDGEFMTFNHMQVMQYSPRELMIKNPNNAVIDYLDTTTHELVLRIDRVCGIDQPLSSISTYTTTLPLRTREEFCLRDLKADAMARAPHE
jgi:hypothetical protein